MQRLLDGDGVCRVAREHCRLVWLARSAGEVLSVRANERG